MPRAYVVNYLNGLRISGKEKQDFNGLRAGEGEKDGAYGVCL
jgi:hypothetical protein